MEIAVIFDKLVPGTTGVYVIRALQKLGHKIAHYWLRDADEIPLKFDLYLRVDHGYYERDLPSSLKPSAYWALDIHLEHGLNALKRSWHNYNFLFGAHRNQVEKLKNQGIPIEWLPFACDSEIHYKKNHPMVYDVAFVGGDFGTPRKFLLQEIRERYPQSFIGEAPYSEMSDIYSRAKIGFNYSIRSEINMRFFEVMSCGSMLLTNELPRQDLEMLDLLPGRDFVEFVSFEELFKKLEYYLKHDDERTPIAQSGYHRVRNHTYTHRMEKALEVIQNRNSYL